MTDGLCPPVLSDVRIMAIGSEKDMSSYRFEMDCTFIISRMCPV